jgi:hypothetical protein
LRSDLDTPLLGPSALRRLAGLPLVAYWRLALAIAGRLA